jgi:hypothetical protein
MIIVIFMANTGLAGQRVVRLLRKDPRELRNSGTDRFCDALGVIGGTYLIAQMVFSSGFSNPARLNELVTMPVWVGYLLAGLIIASTVFIVASVILTNRILDKPPGGQP